MQAVLITSDLMLGSQVSGAAAQHGVSLTMLMDAGQLADHAATETIALVVVDLATPRLDLSNVIQQLLAACDPVPRIIALGPHVQPAALQAAQDAGCDEVFTRGQFHAQMNDVFAHIG